ncbi:hypothetical protein [Amorphus orientalis]|uniref:Uncharacterized protein n=1 Tax=Amorphus orientalis TaxID=649198 RepID=A0AAE3VQQ5_9HYPH|nr:hypothetical protein [Amorphus orientalis]MDQ0316445.1 hypothetical protein [Amorphus orientalis]
MNTDSTLETAVFHALQSPPPSIVGQIDVFGYEGEALLRDLSRRSRIYAEQMDQWIQEGEQIKASLRDLYAGGPNVTQDFKFFEKAAQSLETAAERDAEKYAGVIRRLWGELEAGGHRFESHAHPIGECLELIENTTGREIDATLEMALFLRALNAECKQDSEEVAFEITPEDTAATVKGKFESAA